MKLYENYIVKTILSATTTVTFVFLCITVFIKFVGEMRHLGSGDYDLLQAMDFVIQTIPISLYSLFPMIALIGSLVALGQLAENSELIVMQTSGVSLYAIHKAVVKGALVLIVVMTIVGEWFAPLWANHASMYKAIALSGGQALMTEQGTWVKEGNHFIHIQRQLDDGRLYGVTRYTFDKHHRLVRASYAKYAYYRDGYWVMQDVSESLIDESGVQTKTYPEWRWSMALSPSLLGSSLDMPDEMSLSRLKQFIVYQTESGLNAMAYDFVFWKRVLRPLATLIMIWLGVPFVLGSLRSRTMGFRLLVGILIGFCFYILNEFLGPLSLVYQFPPFLAAFLPLVLFSSIGFYRVSGLRA